MNTRDVVLIALFAAITVALGLAPRIPIAFLPVPITLQSLGPMLAGAMIGPIRGALAHVLVVLLVAIGLPVLAGGSGGLGALAGPTAGFIFGWIIAAFVTGMLCKAWSRGRRAGGRSGVWTDIGLIFLACVIGGIVVLYACGVAWLALVTGIGFEKALTGVLVFIPGDLVKAAFAALIAHNVRRAYPLDLK
ncbi:biotin transporter BioY [Rhodoligotrophos defluvii]|uniref:biotin transporter BioY n=1 Tax=Rhodoligotrophos defluvii TaxID=2561934 RepID=UPI0010C9FA27|nr:biotin transporter BioY [Rhodoligotrophos defluvii]